MVTLTLADLQLTMIRIRPLKFCFGLGWAATAVLPADNVWELAQVAQGGCGISILGESQRHLAMVLDYLAGPAWAEGLDQMTSRSPFQILILDSSHGFSALSVLSCHYRKVKVISLPSPNGNASKGKGHIGFPSPGKERVHWKSHWSVIPTPEGWMN